MAVVLIPLATRAINFFLLPFLLHYLTAADFFQVTILTAYSLGIQSLVLFGSAPRLIAAFHESNNRTALFQEFVKRIVSIWSFILIVVLFIAYFTAKDLVVILTLVTLDALICVILGELVSRLMQIVGDWKGFIIQGLITLILLGPIRVLFLIFISKSVILFFALGTCMRAIIGVVAYHRIFNDSPTKIVRLDSSRFKIFELNSASIILVGLLIWGSTYIDRFFLLRYFPPIDQATYQVTYQVASLIGLILAQLANLHAIKILQGNDKERLSKNIGILTREYIVLASILFFPLLMFQQIFFTAK